MRRRADKENTRQPAGVGELTMMVRAFLPISIAAIVLLSRIAHGQGTNPFEAADWPIPANAVDAPVTAALQEQGLDLRPPCSDEVFIRRAFIDVIGTLPQPQEIEAFLEDTSPDKRARLIDGLFDREEFVDYQTLKWCDILRVKSEFPIKLWPNAVQAYHAWVRQAIRDNMAYDRFARELLTSSGSNFRVAAANFYRAIQGRDPKAIAAAVALTFMGTRFDTWSEGQQADLAAFFSKVAYKPTREWKEEIVYFDSSGAEPMAVTFPDGTTATIPANRDPREVFADWLVAPGNTRFSQAAANRAWYWLMGQGIVHEADDIREDNPPPCPELLALLGTEFAGSGYDTRHLLRLILNSRTYQQSSVASDPVPEAARFAYYTIRRLDAEVLVDALCWIGGRGEEYSSPIPEPFTFTPSTQRTIALADGSITSRFLETFGRPARDTGMLSERNNEPSDAQRMYLINSTEVRQRIENSRLLSDIYDASEGDSDRLVSDTYLLLLSRRPTPSEQSAAEEYLQSRGSQGRGAFNDLAWALVNSKEFLCRH